MRTLLVSLCTIGVCSAFLISTSEAAKPRQLKQSLKRKVTPSKKDFKAKKTVTITIADKKKAEDALKLPLKNRVAVIKSQGIKSFYALKSISMDESKGTQARWKALITFAIIGKKRAQSLVNKLTRSKKWYMRNAALIASKHVEKSFALDMAKRLIADHALVVRTEAVKIIDKLGNASHKDLLWGQLNSPINFRNGRSLWVRKHITEALANKASDADIPNFALLLTDQDIHVRKFAVLGLESIHSQRLSKSKSLKEHVRLWREKIRL